MRISRINTALLTLTVAIQCVILYQMATARPRAPEPVRLAPNNETLDVAGMPVMGSSAAGVVLVEFSDYECPFCRRHATGVLQELKRQYVQTGKVRYAFANNPLAMHRNARLLARSAICAGRQHRYWDLHDRLFEMQPKDENEIARLVDDTKLERDAFQDCMRDEVSATKIIDADVRIATGLGFLSTPSFAVGRIAADGRVRLAKLIVGAQPLAVFQSAIDDLMEGGSTRRSLVDWLRDPS